MNKIKYNLKNVHYAKRTVIGDAATYEEPVPIPGSVSLSLSAQGGISPFHADGVVYFKAESNNGYEGDLEIALVPESFRTSILGETLDESGVLIENANKIGYSFALLFEFSGDEKNIRHVLYNCSATRPSIESKTKEESIEPVTESLSISATPDEDGNVKAKTGNDTSTEAYDSWYSKVYQG